MQVPKTTVLCTVQANNGPYNDNGSIHTEHRKLYLKDEITKSSFFSNFKI